MTFGRAALAFLILISAIPIALALSQPGDECNYTGQCEQGYCLDGKCQLPDLISSRPLGACIETADCLEGYCADGECILPTAKAEILEIGIKGGCSGFTEETGALGSFAICEAVWILVPVFAVAAAYVSARGGNGRFITLAVLLLPIFIALIFFAFLGIMFALAEMALLLSRRKTGPQ